MLAAVLQRDGDVEEPKAEDMYRIGTAARIMKILEMPNGNLTVILQRVGEGRDRRIRLVRPLSASQGDPVEGFDARREERRVQRTCGFDPATWRSISSTSRPTCPRRPIFAIKNIDSRARYHQLHLHQPRTVGRRPAVAARSAGPAGARAQTARNPDPRPTAHRVEERDPGARSSRRSTSSSATTTSSSRCAPSRTNWATAPTPNMDEMREKAKQKNWPKEVAELFEKELQKLERLNPAVAEYSVQVTYLQLLLELPWNDCTKDNLDLKQAREAARPRPFRPRRGQGARCWNTWRSSS